jgi:hypothetical protein
MAIDREPIPLGSYVIEPRSEGRWQALRCDMLASHVGSMEDVLQAIAVDVAVRQDAIDADRAAMGGVMRYEYMHVQCSTLDDLARLGEMGWQAAALVEDDAGGRRTWSGLMMRAMVMP